ncbi:carboxylate-amine ligase [Saccharopolyspora antimicrobica]|uniref:Putative glutamate--cysteine ligase 2 n=1 Tax=Saccharopolyspora antimicrobica TaxID=455193 RepID=A0A1I4TLC4_9PSEU|nr:glutamate--cysteine ligase [Saccharopolyspora antimicrobica]RKT88459.1 carboxylate-amine ligase [Saccharopolyspora antimicrobica]SFM77476.1 carboxylate-amine ligase [Saccharopolyspora antimicrobica]
MRRGRPPTFGVEEEFLLLHPGTGHPAPHAPEILRQVGHAFTAELAEFQLESNTPVCRTADEAHRALTAARQELAEAADRRGSLLVSTGFAPLGLPDPLPLTDKSRYRTIRERFGQLLDSHTAAGCHVHVGMPDLASALAVSDHLRPHLPALLALTANSPFCGGRDTGHASWRSVMWSRLPSAGPPPLHRNTSSYRQSVQLLLNSGAALDRAMVYWLVRPAEHLSTLEFRIADATGTAEESLLLALLIRALATIALQDVAEGRPPAELPDQRLRLALWRAAHDGLEGDGLDADGELVPARFLVEKLCKTAQPALEASGDSARVDDILSRLFRHGSGAQRQRRAHERRHDMADVLALLAEQTRTALPD